MCSYSIAVYRAPDNSVWVFDSHARSPTTGLAYGLGTAVLVQLAGIPELVQHVIGLYGSANREYQLSPVILLGAAVSPSGGRPVAVQGTTHQFDECFPASGLGRQLAAMSAAACCWSP